MTCPTQTVGQQMPIEGRLTFLMRLFSSSAHIKIWFATNDAKPQPSV
jgi:hypothetical protein